MEAGPHSAAAAAVETLGLLQPRTALEAAACVSQSSAATVNPAANRRRGDRGNTAHSSPRKHQTVVLEAIICLISLFLSFCFSTTILFFISALVPQNRCLGESKI